MRIVLSPRSEKELKKIRRINQIAVIKKLRSLRDSSRETKKEKLSGYSDIFRIRVGQYRIVYRQKKGKIHIVLIAHRKDIYQLLQRFIG